MIWLQLLSTVNHAGGSYAHLPSYIILNWKHIDYSRTVLIIADNIIVLTLQNYFNIIASNF